MATIGQKAAYGCGIVIAISIAALVIIGGVIAIAGCGIWWNYSGEELEEVAIVTDPEAEVTEPEATEVADGEETVETPEDLGDNESWLPSWMRPSDDESDTIDNGEESVVEDDTPVVDDATTTVSTTSTPPTATSTPPVVVKGVAAHGTMFPAPGKNGATSPTAALVIGDIAESAKCANGETEEIWIQGTHTDPDDGSRRTDIGNVVLDPDDIRRVVGIKTVWTTVPGYTGVTAKCVVTHTKDGDTAGDCSRVPDASRVASR